MIVGVWHASSNLNLSRHALVFGHEILYLSIVEIEISPKCIGLEQLSSWISHKILSIKQMMFRAM